MSNLTYWISKGHLFIDNSCVQDNKPLPGLPLTPTLSTIVGELNLQNKHALDLGTREHPKYSLHLLCMNTAVLDERDWSQPLILRCHQCKQQYEFTQTMYEQEKEKVPKKKKRF